MRTLDVTHLSRARIQLNGPSVGRARRLAVWAPHCTHERQVRLRVSVARGNARGGDQHAKGVVVVLHAHERATERAEHRAVGLVDGLDELLGAAAVVGGVWRVVLDEPNLLEEEVIWGVAGHGAGGGQAGNQGQQGLLEHRGAISRR